MSSAYHSGSAQNASGMLSGFGKSNVSEKGVVFVIELNKYAASDV